MTQCLKISVALNGMEQTVFLDGRVDTASSSELEKKLSDNLSGILVLKFDFTQVSFLSSAGLRVLINMVKKMTARGGSLKVVHANSSVRQLFEVTNFKKYAEIEP